MKNIHKLALLALAGVAFSTQALAITIGYYDSSRELYGFANNGYLSNARDWLTAQGNTLVAINYADSAALSHVDAFYTGLISTVDATEVAAFQNFVNVQGGFLFIQTDWADATWTAPANQILSSWGIVDSGSYTDDSGNHTVGTSSWVTDPNTVTGLTTSAHSVITSAPSNFEVLAQDDANRTILGVFDAGAGRSSDVLISTDINMWDNSYGYADTRNQQLWANIWTSATTQIDGGNTVPDSGSTLALLGLALCAISGLRRRMHA